MRFFILLVLCFSASVALAQRQLTTIELSYADPQQIKAVIMPLLSQGSSVSVYQDQLILNVTAEELAKTRELLTQLDGAGRQLLVSLRSDAVGSSSQRGVDIDGSIHAGDTTINTGSGGYTTETRTNIRVNNNRGTSTDNGNQSVRATEGMPAYIATGMTAPIQSYTVGPDGRRYYQQDYVDAVSGFYATARVNDGIVQISIDQSNNQLKGQTIATQQLQSQVSGALGQWLPIGAIGNSANLQEQGIGSRGQSSRATSTQLFIKVELLP
jgi:hypothetical protein